MVAVNRINLEGHKGGFEKNPFIEKFSRRGSLIMSRDPLGYDAGDFNLYRFENGDPVNNLDPYGLFDYSQITKALDNYCSGGKDNWYTSIAYIDWGNYLERVRKAVLNKVGSSCSDRTISFSETVETQTEGADKYIVGRHNLKVDGNIQVKCDCSYSFDGSASSSQGYDTYNFNISNRSWFAETLTSFGRGKCSETSNPFKIYISGKQPVSLSGRISNGKDTCKCEK